MTFKLAKADILRGKTVVDGLFLSGQSFVVYPYRVVYRKRELKENESPARVLVSVSKKRFKRAVKRNRIRRQIKETYRLNRSHLDLFLSDKKVHVDLAVLYIDKTELDYSLLKKRMGELLFKIEKQIDSGLSCPKPDEPNQKEGNITG